MPTKGKSKHQFCVGGIASNFPRAKRTKAFKLKSTVMFGTSFKVKGRTLSLSA